MYRYNTLRAYNIFYIYNNIQRAKNKKNMLFNSISTTII